MSYSQATLVKRIRAELNDNPWFDICVEAMDATETGLDVTDGTKYSVGVVVEFQDDGELCLVTYNGRLYGWTGRKLFEMDIFDSVTATAVTALVKNAAPGYRKVYDTGTNDMIDGNYGGSSINSWWADMVSSETAIYFMVGSRGMTRIYEFKAGIAKPIWFPPIGFTCKSLAVQNGVLFAFGHWAGETSTSHKGGVVLGDTDA